MVKYHWLTKIKEDDLTCALLTLLNGQVTKFSLHMYTNLSMSYVIAEYVDLTTM